MSIELCLFYGREISWVPPVGGVWDVTLRNRRREAIGVANGPIRQQAAAAATCHAEFCIVDVTATNHLIDTNHQVFVVVARIVVLDDVAEVLAIRGAAAWIWIEDHVTFGRHPLKFVIENKAVSGVRPTMNVQN